MSALRAAYESIKDEENWTQGALAKRSSDGRITYCAVGALHKFCRLEDMPLYFGALENAALAMGADVDEVSAPAWVNDVLGHEAVLQMFEKAIVETEGGL